MSAQNVNFNRKFLQNWSLAPNLAIAVQFFHTMKYCGQFSDNSKFIGGGQLPLLTTRLRHHTDSECWCCHCQVDAMSKAVRSAVYVIVVIVISSCSSSSSSARVSNTLSLPWRQSTLSAHRRRLSITLRHTASVRPKDHNVLCHWHNTVSCK